METLALWSGFVGAWLLVAGPIYQAALELREEQIETDHVDTVRKQVTQHPRISAWWWLLPPIKIILERRSNEAYRNAFLAALPDEDVEVMISFMNKATGWLYVASGGFLLAVKETYELIDHLELARLWFWIIILVLALASVGNTALRISRSEKIIRKHT